MVNLGYQNVIRPALTGAMFAAMVMASNAVVRHDAKQENAEYVRGLETILAKCLSRGDNPVTIGGELWFCGAAPTGIRTSGHLAINKQGVAN